MSEITVAALLDTATVALRDVVCRGRCRGEGSLECAHRTELVFPYRGLYVRHVSDDVAVAEANQVLFFNAGEPYRVSHPVAGGDASLSVAIDEALLHELVPRELVRGGPRLAFRTQRRRVDARTQALAALLRHSLARGSIERLEAETLALTLARRALGERSTHAPRGSAGHRKLVDRTKLVLASDLSRRWTLADIAQAVRVSPVYLTQVFQQVEAVPLYRYQLHLRLARALDLLARDAELAALGTELGFSSHSHFTSAFRRAFGRAPAAFRRAFCR
jgi:AraC-like DNA-binding protein